MLTQAELQLVKDEYTNDPVGRGYAGAPTAESKHALFVEAISQSPPVYQKPDVVLADLAFILIERGKWENVVIAHGDAGAAGHTNAFALVEAARLGVSANYDRVSTAITGLITAGVLSAADGTALQDATRTEILKSRKQIILGTKDFLYSDSQAAMDLP